MSSIRPTDLQSLAAASAAAQANEPNSADQAAAAAKSSAEAPLAPATTLDPVTGQVVLAPAIAANTPVLPAASGPAAGPVAANLGLNAVNNAGYSLPTGAMAFSIVWEAMQKVQGLLAKTKTAAQQVANSSAVAGALSGIKEIQAKQSEAWFNLGKGLLAAGVPAAMGIKGAKDGGAWGAGWTAGAQGAGNALSALGDAANLNLGYGKDASSAQIAKNQADLQKTFYQQQTDGQDAAKKQSDQALEQTVSLLQEYYRRQSDTIKAIAS